MMIRCPKHGIYHDDQAAGCWKCLDSTPWPSRPSWGARSNSSTPMPVDEMGVEAMAEFSIGEAIKFGWSTATGNLGLYLVAMVIWIMIEMMPAILTKSIVVTTVGWVLGLVVTMGIMKMSLRFVDGDHGELADLFATFPSLISYILASFLVGIIVTIGMLLLIVPGIILGIRLQMYVWAIVDNHAGPIEALQQSWTMTRGFAWNLFLLNLLLGLINMLGMLAIGIGLVVTVPLSMVAWGHAYRRLEGSAAI